MRGASALDQLLAEFPDADLQAQVVWEPVLATDVAAPLTGVRGVTLLSAGLDEVPMAYKDIEAVMAAQADLVEPIARFQPRIVKMAGPGEPPED